MIFRSSTRKWVLLILGILVALLIVSLWRGSGRKRPAIVQLADGRRVELVGVTVGPEHRLHKPGPRDVIYSLAPAAIKKVIGPNFSSSFEFSGSGIALWLMCFDPVSETYAGGWIDRISVLDEHGCEFESSGSGGTGDGYFQANVIELPVFPRRQKSFTCRMIKSVNGSPQELGEFALQNPLTPEQLEIKEWTPEPLPATKTNGSLVVRLNGFRAGRQANFTLSGEENAPTNWELSEARFEDPTGNRGIFLCPKEKSWKWRGLFYRNQYATFDSSESWSLTNISIPAPGKVNPLQLTNLISERPIALLQFAGAANYVYSNGVWTAVPGTRQGISSVMRNVSGSQVTAISVGYNQPFIVASHPHLSGDVKLLFRLRDGNEIVALASGASGTGGKWFYEFNSFGAAKGWMTNTALTLDVILQRGREFEFFVAPGAALAEK